MSGQPAIRTTLIPGCRVLILILDCLICMPEGIGRGGPDFTEQEMIMKAWFDEIAGSRDDAGKMEINHHITDLFGKLLTLEESFRYPFDSLTRIGKLTSPDNRVRIITWNLSFQDGTHRYYGFVQHHMKRKDQVRTFFLEDRSEGITDPEISGLPAERWYGALYYEIIPVTLRQKTYYTLLGVDFNDLFTTRKVIDVLYFDGEGTVWFGFPVFSDGKHTQHRVLFEYSSRVAMNLKYVKSRKMILFDHLSPSDPRYTGQFAHYGPDASVDGFHFADGMWNYRRDIDVKGMD